MADEVFSDGYVISKLSVKVEEHSDLMEGCRTSINVAV